MIPELGKSYAELPAEEKNKISHRANALIKLKEALRQYHESGRY
jgi:XTP/dITP diphosphohydrolase